MQWKFSLDENNGIVKLLSVGNPDDSVPSDWHEEVKPGGNFCGVKYAAMYHAKLGILDVSWERFAKWRQNR